MLAELFASLGIISLVSLLGALFFGIKSARLEHYLELMVAFAAGTLLGDVFIHLLPELVENGFSIEISSSILLGIIIFFVLEKFVHWHHCHHATHAHKYKTFSYLSLAGDLIHNLIDGIILAGAFLTSPVAGFSTAVAIFFHELPQEISDFGVLIKGGFSRKKALAFNFITSLTAFVGAIIALLAQQFIAGITPILIGFAVGGFLYIAGTDFLPQLHSEDFSKKKALLQLIFLILGMGAMFLLLIVG